jgi:hypothetical protein
MYTTFGDPGFARTGSGHHAVDSVPYRPITPPNRCAITDLLLNYRRSAGFQPARCTNLSAGANL